MFTGWPLAHRFGLSPSHILLSLPFLMCPLPQPSVPCPFFTVKAKGSPFTQTFQGPPCVETTPPAPFTVCPSTDQQGICGGGGKGVLCCADSSRASV